MKIVYNKNQTDTCMLIQRKVRKLSLAVKAVIDIFPRLQKIETCMLMSGQVHTCFSAPSPHFTTYDVDTHSYYMYTHTHTHAHTHTYTCTHTHIHTHTHTHTHTRTHVHITYYSTDEYFVKFSTQELMGVVHTDPL